MCPEQRPSFPNTANTRQRLMHERTRSCRCPKQGGNSSSSLTTPVLRSVYNINASLLGFVCPLGLPSLVVWWLGSVECGGCLTLINVCQHVFETLKGPNRNCVVTHIQWCFIGSSSSVSLCLYVCVSVCMCVGVGVYTMCVCVCVCVYVYSLHVCVCTLCVCVIRSESVWQISSRRVESCRSCGPSNRAG